jgi:hypothetical protein
VIPRRNFLIGSVMAAATGAAALNAAAAETATLPALDAAAAATDAN